MPTKEFLEDKQQITLYPTKAQHKKLKELAAKRGKNLSTYILDSAFRDEKIHEKLDRIIGMLECAKLEKALPVMPRDKETAEALFNGEHPHKNTSKPQMVNYLGKGEK